jgi:hypothetical protein
MWNKILPYLYTKTPHDKSQDLINSIIFEIDHNNKINLKVKIENKSIEAADQLGLLLFLLNEGYYVQLFLDTISNISKNDTCRAEFIQKVINAWSNKIKESDTYTTNSSENDPLIKPTQFNLGK